VRLIADDRRFHGGYVHLAGKHASVHLQQQLLQRFIPSLNNIPIRGLNRHECDVSLIPLPEQPIENQPTNPWQDVFLFSKRELNFVFCFLPVLGNPDAGVHIKIIFVWVSLMRRGGGNLIASVFLPLDGFFLLFFLNASVKHPPCSCSISGHSFT